MKNKNKLEPEVTEPEVTEPEKEGILELLHKELNQLQSQLEDPEVVEIEEDPEVVEEDPEVTDPEVVEEELSELESLQKELANLKLKSAVTDKCLEYGVTEPKIVTAITEAIETNPIELVDILLQSMKKEPTEPNKVVEETTVKKEKGNYSKIL